MRWFTKAVLVLVCCFSELAHSRYSLSALSGNRVGSIVCRTLLDDKSISNKVKSQI